MGMDVSLETAADALEKLDFRVEQVSQVAAAANPESTFALHRHGDEPLLACAAPWHRLDVRIPADLIEEVARMIGYEKVGTTLIVDELPTQHRNQMLQTEEKIRDILVGAGLQENINHPLTTAESHQKLTPHAADSKQPPFITITNPSVETRRSMRRTLTVSALEGLARNLRFVSRSTTFEVGRVYLPEDGDGVLPREVRRVSVLLTGARQAENFYRTAEGGEEMDFFDLKGVVETWCSISVFRSPTWSFAPNRIRPPLARVAPRYSSRGTIWASSAKSILKCAPPLACPRCASAWPSWILRH
ncbi:MAG: hypothetical protein HC802_17720 [Caldilineaceae bacterium]|nr:hypothetical protein [Caldilineaceae bacterium]